MKTKYIFITGGAGYIGSATAEALLKAGHHVTVYDSLVTGHRPAVPEGAKFIHAELSDSLALAIALKEDKYDAVMHFAAFLNVGESVQRPLAYWRNNVANTLNLLESMEAHGVRRFVFSSTCAVYGQPDELPIVEDLPKAPISPYGCTKLSVEWMLQNCAVAWGLGSIALRYFNAAGAAEDGSLGEDHDPEIHLIPLVLRVALGQRESIPVFGTDYPTPDGSCIRDYIHVDDLAEAHLRAVEAVQPGEFEAFNVGTGRGYSVLEIIAAAREVTQHPIPIDPAPRRPGDPPLLFADPGRLQARFNWLPRHKDVRQIIRTAWRWMQAHPHGYGD